MSVLGYVELLKASQILITRTQETSSFLQSPGRYICLVIPDLTLVLAPGKKVDPMIEIRDLHKYFGALHVLKGIDLDVQNGF